MVEQKTTCPLCTQNTASLFYQDSSRQYLRCSVCDLTFVPSHFHLSGTDEKAVYDQHQNSPDDHGYRRFLNRIFEPLQLRLLPGSSGLDFGSGPGPTLSVMFAESGHDVVIYDPYYAPHVELLNRQYDFVTASEVVEHFCRPLQDFERMWACVKPGGLLGIMTKRAGNPEAFANWHYKNDPTHVSFYSQETFFWLADVWNAKLEVLCDDVVVFRHTDE
jgi:SAM-dependent methyltransferase